jgi:alanine-glyoxylate transaminase/serine-glyoxylate transaminase/serine-pyruvate transaminase
MLYALYQALMLVLEEGLDKIIIRHEQCHLKLVNGLRDMGLEMLVEASYRLPMLNTVKCPTGIDELAARRFLRSEHRIEIGGGLGPLAGKIWRIGLMGHTARPENVDRFLAALKSSL